METVRVITSENERVAVQTFHPLVEVRKAKENCDAIKAGTFKGMRGGYEIHTVSTDAASVYLYYGKSVLGLDVHFYIDDRETDLEGMFESFNKSYALLEEIGIDKD